MLFGIFFKKAKARRYAVFKYVNTYNPKTGIYSFNVGLMAMGVAMVVGMIVIGILGVIIDRLLMRLTQLPSVRWGYDR